MEFSIGIRSIALVYLSEFLTFIEFYKSFGNLMNGVQKAAEVTDPLKYIYSLQHLR